MQRRNFLSLIGAAAVAPALPASAASVTRASASVVAAAGYNRYMYGLAVFQARTRASITAADLVARLGVSAPQASAMMGEMTARGVLSSVTGAARVAATAPPRKPYVRKLMRQIAGMTDDPADPLNPDPPRLHPLKSDPASARPVHTQCTSCDN